MSIPNVTPAYMVGYNDPEEHAQNPFVAGTQHAMDWYWGHSDMIYEDRAGYCGNEEEV